MWCYYVNELWKGKTAGVSPLQLNCASLKRKEKRKQQGRCKNPHSRVQQVTYCLHSPKEPFFKHKNNNTSFENRCPEPWLWIWGCYCSIAQPSASSAAALETNRQAWEKAKPWECLPEKGNLQGWPESDEDRGGCRELCFSAVEAHVGLCRGLPLLPQHLLGDWDLCFLTYSLP